MRGSTRWTQAEKDIVIEEIKNYPTNLSHAFTKASERLTNRSHGTISFMYYHYLRHDPSIHAVTVGSEKGFSQNVKNIKRDKENNLPEQGLRHFQYLIREILLLSPEERTLVLSIFN